MSTPTKGTPGRLPGKYKVYTEEKLARLTADQLQRFNRLVEIRKQRAATRGEKYPEANLLRDLIDEEAARQGIDK